MESLTLHSYEWQVKDEYNPDGSLAILSWCLDRDSKPYLIRFQDFPTFCTIELPLFIGNRRVNWTSYKANQVYNSICWKLGEDRPFKYFFRMKEKLYYYRGGKMYPMLVVLFRTIKAMKSCFYRLQKPFKVKDLGLVACKVWETKISLVRKLLTLRNMKYCQWFTIEAIKVPENDKVSKLDLEYIGDHRTMSPIPAEETGSWVTQPTILSFDIETYSDRHTALPDPYTSKHVVYMVSCVYQRSGDPSSRVKDIILYGDCEDTDMANVIKVKSEIDLIDTMSDLVNKYDPDILTGYNIFGYDNPYLDTRLKRRLREWKPMGRLINESTYLESFSWGSSGYGHNEINILKMDGRIMIDLLPIIRRDYKLSLYNLGFVSNFFLGRTKHPVTAQEMFETYEICKDNHKEEYTDKSLKDYLLDKYPNYHNTKNKEEILDSLHLDQYFSNTKDIDVLSDISLKDHAMREMRKVVEYCVVDSDLVLDIFEKIHCWIALIEMSNVVGVTLVELFTRGQQLRVLSQVYDEASKDGIVIDERVVPKIDYTGGFVYDPIPGIYHYVPCLDFKSLYPTVMISHNIDYRTFIPPEMMDQVPDDMCHIIEWNEEAKPDETDVTDDESDESDGSDRSSEIKEPEKVYYKFKFIKQEHLQGILPRLLVRLITERDAVRKLQKNFKKGSVEWIVLERRQLALKISANSMYGALGAQNGGKLPLPEAAACVTAKSRESIQKVNSYLESKGHKIVYGDSVTGDTPILVQTNSFTGYIEIQNLWRGNWIRENGKNYASLDGIKVWSDQGFTDIKHIMKHKTRKRLYRIISDAGVITVTEDHSLLYKDGTEVSPKDLSVGDCLLTKSLPNLKIITKTSGKMVKMANTYLQNSDSVSIDISDNQIGYTLNLFGRKKVKGIVSKIEDLGYIDDYVYDLETENHHFSAGVGELVVHNTDSSMPDIGITDPATAFERAKEVAEELSALFPPPMLVEDEDVYHTMLCIAKKMYICILMDREGNPILDKTKMKFKGTLPARRDNCNYQKESYIEIAWRVLNEQPMMETYNKIIDICIRLARREIHWKDLVMIKGLGSHYKNKSYCMKVFADELCRIGKPASPGDRLEYVIVKSLGVEGKQLLGYKMRLPSTYLERLDSPNPEYIDYIYYMEKLLANGIEKQLFQIGYQEDLKELDMKYLESDRSKVLKGLREKGYGVVVDQMITKFGHDRKGEIIDYLIDHTRLKDIVKRLVSYHIKKRRRIVTRVNGEPVKMMVKLIQAKRQYINDIKKLVKLEDIPKIYPVQLNIVTPDLGMSKEEIVRNWTDNKIKRIKLGLK